MGKTATFPLKTALSGYSKKNLRADAIAGLTTAVMLVPQGMAYAMLAGLPPIIGLYAGLIPPLVYAFVGTSRQLAVGPVAMDSLLVFAGVGALYEAGTEQFVSTAILLALMVGVLQVAMGALRLGFLVNFLSRPVISGFTSAAALVIGLSQFKHLMGVPVEGSQSVVTLVGNVAEQVPHANLLTLAVGLVSVALLFSVKKLAPKVPGALLVVVLGASTVGLLGLGDRIGIVGTVPAGLPVPSLSHFDWALVRTLLPTAATIALVAFMESISVSQTYARKNRYELDADRELIALGASNIVGSFFQGYPVTGGFSRTAVNAAAGAKTQLAGLFTALLVGATLLLLTPLFYYLPKAVLASIIVVAVVGLIDFTQVRRLHRVKRADLTLLSVAFFATLGLGIVEGMATGVVASLLWFVFKTTRPHVAVLGRVPGTTRFRNVARHVGLITYEGVIAIRMDAQFYFGNVSFLKEKLHELEVEMPTPLAAIVLDASAINNLDSSAEAALSEMVDQYRARGVQLCLAAVKGPVLDVMERSGLTESLGVDARYPTVFDAISAVDHRSHVRAVPAVGGTNGEGEGASRLSAQL